MRSFRIIALLCLIIQNSQQKVLPTVPENDENIRTLQDSDLADPGYDNIDGIKEKRCHDPSRYNLVGSIQRPKLSLPLVLKRRDLALKKSTCDICRATFCKNPQSSTCDHCEKICQENTAETANAPILESRNFQEGGLSENQDRYYSVGAVGPGPRQDIIARLLNIPKHAKLDRLIILAKNRSNKKADAMPHPVIIDTAHVFTPNDGNAPELDPELHNVGENGNDFESLTKELNKELDVAIETKKKLRGESRLTTDEIDKIIQHATKQISHHTKNLPEEDFNKDNIVGAEQKSIQSSKKHEEEEVGCSKETDESDEYYREAGNGGDKNLEDQSSKSKKINNFKEEQVGRSKSDESVEMMYVPPNIYRNAEDTKGEINTNGMEDTVVGAAHQDLSEKAESPEGENVLESKFKHKKKGKGHKGYYRENNEDVNLEARNQKSSEENQVSDEDVKSKETEEIIKENQELETKNQMPLNQTEEQKSENIEEENILEKKFKHKKKGKGGYFRENSDAEEEEETTTVSETKDEGADVDETIKNDGILQTKFKKHKKKKGKGYSSGYGYYRENESDDTQRSAVPAYQDTPQYIPNYQDNQGAQYGNGKNQQYQSPNYPVGGNQYQPPSNQYQPMNNQYQPSRNQYQSMPNGYENMNNGYQPMKSGYQNSNQYYPNEYQPINSGYQSKNQYQPMSKDYKSSKTYQPSNNYQSPNQYQTPVKSYQQATSQYQTNQPKNYQMAKQDPYQPELIHMPAQDAPAPTSQNQYATNYEIPDEVNNRYQGSTYDNQESNELEPVEINEDLPVYAKVQSEESEGGEYDDYLVGAAPNTTKHEETAETGEKTQNDKAIEPLATDWSKQYDSIKQWLQENSDNHEKLISELPQFLQDLEGKEKHFKYPNNKTIDKLKKDVTSKIEYLSKEKLGAVQENLVDNNETVGCSKESGEDEELMFLKPLYGNDYRNSKNGQNSLLADIDKILHPGKKVDESKKAEDPLEEIVHNNHESLLEPVREMEESMKKLLHPKSRKDESGEDTKEPSSPALSSLIKDLEKIRENLPTLPPLHLRKHHHPHPSALPSKNGIIDEQHDNMNVNPDQVNGDFGENFEEDRRGFVENGGDPNFMDFDGARNFNNPDEFGEMPPNNIPRQFGPNFGNFQPEMKARNSNFHNFRNINPGFFERPDILGASNYHHGLSHFGKMVPAHLPELNIHNRDVSEQVDEKKGKKMFFVGDGIKLPLHMKEHGDGSLHLSVDVHKLCKCNSTKCEHNHGDFLDVKKVKDGSEKNVIKRSPKFDLFNNQNIKEYELDTKTGIEESHEKKEGVFQNVLDWLEKLAVQDLKEV